jgi:hypothetical protein
MASSVFQVLNPQDAVIIGHLPLKSDVSAPKNGMPVKLATGELVAATDHVSIGLLCELDQRGVVPWALYDRTDANDLTAWKGKKVGVLVKGIVRLPVAMVTGTLAEGAKVESVNGTTYAVTAATVGVGTILNADVRNQYGSAVQYVDIAFDFTSGAVPT